MNYFAGAFSLILQKFRNIFNHLKRLDFSKFRYIWDPHFVLNSASISIFHVILGTIKSTFHFTKSGCNNMDKHSFWSKNPSISTGERPFIDILQDRRYWVIHLITIPSLFLAGVIFILSGFVYKLFGVANFMRYFYNVPINTQISLINDRFSIFLFIEDV